METKCAAFWKHTNLRSDNKIFPCCRFKQSVQTFDGNLDTILHSSQYQELRKKSSNNEFILDCQKCYTEEQLGKKSLRQQFNEEYDTTTVALEYFEVGFDNICNLTCDGCWEEFSSEWGKKIMLLKSEIVKTTSDFTNIPDTITKVLFLGGEPLMTSRHKKFLESFDNLSKLTVIYNTNGTFLLDDNTVTLLKKCKTVNFIVSVDGYGKLNETVRSGSKWHEVVSFINQLSNLNFDFAIHTTLHLNNWSGLKELSEFVKSLNAKWTVNILTYPKHLDIINVKDKKLFIDALKEIEIPSKEYIISHIGIY